MDNHEKKLFTFLKYAQVAASDSKDSTKIGAIVIDDDYCIRTTGWNGFPRGVKHLPWRDFRPAKYFWTAHAEFNAIIQAARVGVPLKDCSIIIAGGKPPCTICANAIIQAGIIRVFYTDDGLQTRDKWKVEWEIAQQALTEANVKLIRY